MAGRIRKECEKQQKDLSFTFGTVKQRARKERRKKQGKANNNFASAHREKGVRIIKERIQHQSFYNFFLLATCGNMLAQHIFYYHGYFQHYSHCISISFMKPALLALSCDSQL